MSAMNKPVVLTPFVVSSLALYHIFKRNGECERLVFTDNNPRLHGMSYDGAEIISAGEARSKYPDAKIIICAYHHVKSIATQYRRLGFADIETDYGGYFDENAAQTAVQAVDMEQALAVNRDMQNDIEHFAKFWRCDILPDFARTPDAVVIDHVSLSVSQRCTLRCRDCATLMQYYPFPVDYSLESNIATVDRFMEKVDYVRKFGLYGGEPFLYGSRLSEIITHIGENYIQTREGAGKHPGRLGMLVVSTNATIVPDVKTLDALRRFDAHINVSDYGRRSSKLSELISVLRAYDISFKRRHDVIWYPMCKITDGEKVSDSEAQERFEKCQSLCNCLCDGKFYYCTFLPSVYHLRAIPYNADNYVDLMDENVTGKDIVNYLGRKNVRMSAYGKFFPGCRYCSGCDYGITPVQSALQTSKPLGYRKYEWR
jgi:hypothetical protein